MKILTAAQLRESEQAAVQNGSSYLELMASAGHAVAQEIMKRYDLLQKKVTVVCGNGNNGGDGFVIADLLRKAGAKVCLLCPLGEPRTETADFYYRHLQSADVVSAFCGDTDFVVDALFGIGLNRAVDGQIGDLIDRINLSDAVRIAVDLPSGVLCDGGVPGKAIRADLTVTLIAAKPCFYLPPSSEYCGEVAVADIGAPPVSYAYLTTEPPLFPKRRKNAHKGDFGTALLVCGSYGMCGAEILAARACLRTGVGIAKALVCDRNYAAFCAAVPEAVTVPVPTGISGGPSVAPEQQNALTAGVSAMLIGCGLGTSPEARRLVFGLLQTATVPVVLDADGINLVCTDISIIKRIKAPVILTPHPGEMARLCRTTADVIEQNRIGYASGFATAYHCIVVLKGANTVIASPDGRVFVNTTGNPGMATGGSGDVLAGMTVSLLAQGVFPLKAATDAVWLHGDAGDRAAQRRSQACMLPGDIIDELNLPEE